MFPVLYINVLGSPLNITAITLTCITAAAAAWSFCLCMQSCQFTFHVLFALVCFFFLSRRSKLWFDVFFAHVTKGINMRVEQKVSHTSLQTSFKDDDDSPPTSWCLRNIDGWRNTLTFFMKQSYQSQKVTHTWQNCEHSVKTCTSTQASIDDF